MNERNGFLDLTHWRHRRIPVLVASLLICGISAAARAEPGAPAMTSPTPAAEPDAGWAAGAATFGYVASGAIFALSLGSELSVDDFGTSLGLGGAALLATIVSVPIVSAGAASARDDSPSGCGGCRVGSWLTYGLGIIGGLGLVGASLAEVEPPSGVILGVGLVGVLSTVLMSLDARASHNDALERPLRPAEPVPSPSPVAPPPSAGPPSAPEECVSGYEVVTDENGYPVRRCRDR